MKSEDVILGIINENSRTGYEIVEVFKTIFSHFFDGSYGSVYPALHKLEQQGMVTKQTVVQEGKPNKFVYSITAQGKEQFKNYLKTSLQPEKVKSDFLMRMYFGEYLTKEEIQDIISHEIRHKEALLEQLNSNYDHWHSKMSRLQQVCYQIGIARYQSELQVLKENGIIE
ncbi:MULTISPECIES: PadR family transcriptional regulator [unclassified Sporolactobacillus]|uniref:PadR family transcriptional regulator n=1 Tax=unclassified Sporolactobacillus TaxID=2628533 RepID=UPI002367DDBE|nr:PadR family transcriptional regulator [Sporolactobacillus sp. CQH2019]MDD9150323.1 PadR family transcriptional regulator [Sporolactobacillus sp. CQH2019]